jgi:glycosyltransferase involved in cell wall biosynthesis
MNHLARKKFISEYGYPADRTRVIYNGVDTGKFAFDPAKRAVLRTKMQVNDGQVVVFAAGRLSPEKGMDVLLDAMAVLPEAERHNIVLMLAGDGPERESLQRRAASLQISGKVAFLGTRDDIPELLSAADVFVNPSRRESFGLSIAEAMSAERCVVATNVGGVPELVNAPAVGLLVPPDSPALLAAAIRRVSLDVGLRQEMGTAAVARIRAEFDLRRSMKHTLDIILGSEAA